MITFVMKRYCASERKIDMKKILTLALAALLAASVLVSCGKPAEKGEEAAVTEKTPIEGDLTIDLAYEKVAEYADAAEDDGTVMLTIDDAVVTANDFRNYYLIMNENYTLSYGADWKNYVGQFFDALDESVCNEYGTIHCFEDMFREKNYTITQEEFQTGVVDAFDEAAAAEDFDLANYGGSKYAYMKYLTFFAFYQKFMAEVNDVMKTIEDGTYEHPEEFLDVAKKYCEDNNVILVKHILIKFPENEDGAEVTDEQKEETRVKAAEILEKVNADGDFDALMAEYGEDPGMQNTPTGYYMTEGQMVPEFEEAAYALGIGEVSDLVETTYGYHIIKRFPLDNDMDAFYKSDAFLNAAYMTFFGSVPEATQNVEVIKADNYDELLAPIVEVGDAYIEKVRAEEEAAQAAEAEEGDTAEEEAGEETETVGGEAEEASEEPAEEDVSEEPADEVPEEAADGE